MPSKKDVDNLDELLKEVPSRFWELRWKTEAQKITRSSLELRAWMESEELRRRITANDES